MAFIFDTNLSLNIEAMAKHGHLSPDEMLTLLAINKAIQEKIIKVDENGIFLLPFDLLRALNPSFEFRIFPQNILRYMRRNNLLGGTRKKYNITNYGQDVIRDLTTPNDNFRRRSNKKKVTDLSPYLLSLKEAGLH